MIISFRTTSSKLWSDYVMVNNGKRDPDKVRVIDGDPELNKQINSMTKFKNCSTTGVISFGKDFDDETIEEIYFDWKKNWLENSGYSEDEYNICAVVHDDTNHKHIHFEINRLNLITGKQNDYYLHKRDIKRRSELQELLEIKYGDVKANEVQRTQHSAERKEEIIAMWREKEGRTLTKDEKKSAFIDLDKIIYDEVNEGNILSFQGVKRFLEDLGLEIDKEAYEMTRLNGLEEDELKIETFKLRVVDEAGYKFNFKGDIYGEYAEPGERKIWRHCRENSKFKEQKEQTRRDEFDERSSNLGKETPEFIGIGRKSGTDPFIELKEDKQYSNADRRTFENIRTKFIRSSEKHRTHLDNRISKKDRQVQSADIEEHRPGNEIIQTGKDNVTNNNVGSSNDVNIPKLQGLPDKERVNTGDAEGKIGNCREDSNTIFSVYQNTKTRQKDLHRIEPRASNAREKWKKLLPSKNNGLENKNISSNTPANFSNNNDNKISDSLLSKLGNLRYKALFGGGLSYEEKLELQRLEKELDSKNDENTLDLRNSNGFNNNTTEDVRIDNNKQEGTNGVVEISAAAIRQSREKVEDYIKKSRREVEQTIGSVSKSREGFRTIQDRIGRDGSIYDKFINDRNLKNKLSEEVNRFKTEISLVDYIENLGGKIDEVRSSENEKFMNFGNKSFSITKNHLGHYKYKDLQTENKQGSIIDFHRNYVDNKAKFQKSIIDIRNYEKGGYTLKITLEFVDKRKLSMERNSNKINDFYDEIDKLKKDGISISFSSGLKAIQSVVGNYNISTLKADTIVLPRELKDMGKDEFNQFLVDNHINIERERYKLNDYRKDIEERKTAIDKYNETLQWFKDNNETTDKSFNFDDKSKNDITDEVKRLNTYKKNLEEVKDKIKEMKSSDKLDKDIKIFYTNRRNMEDVTYTAAGIIINKNGFYKSFASLGVQSQLIFANSIHQDKVKEMDEVFEEIIPNTKFSYSLSTKNKEILTRQEDDTIDINLYKLDSNNIDTNNIQSQYKALENKEFNQQLTNLKIEVDVDGNVYNVFMVDGVMKKEKLSMEKTSEMFKKPEFKELLKKLPKTNKLVQEYRSWKIKKDQIMASIQEPELEKKKKNSSSSGHTQ